MPDSSSALQHIRIRGLRARDPQPQPDETIRWLFAAVLPADVPVDAQFADSRRSSAIGVAGTPFRAPIVGRLLSDPLVGSYLRGLTANGSSALILARPGEPTPDVYVAGSAGVRPPDMPVDVAERLAAALREVPEWPGRLDHLGQHVVGLKSPAPGPHFHVNVLLGNRIGFPRPLQTTPKSVVDRLGRGSFRSHAATQVLATRWDLRPEENGFPANRQFYLVEDGRQIFYSADPADPNVADGHAVHGPNQTTIVYRTHCGLEIARTIFLLPYESGLPLATEVHSITVANRGSRRRRLKLVVTGALGPASPGGLQEDVVYTTVSMEARVLRHEDGSIAAVAPHYHAAWAQEDVRFHATVVHQGGGTSYPTEFCTDYGEFVGVGTLERPAGLALLSNRLGRKGPGFFALAAELDLPAGESARIDNFTGLVSGKDGSGPGEANLEEQVGALLARYSAPGAVDRALADVQTFLDRYSRHLRVHTGDAAFDSYVNTNLPFQVLYQTFVSRSFCLTQKGYREIGFREVQDLLASMPFFITMGHQALVKDLLAEWAGQVHEFGFANHNFYWVGKEPGEWSDDALWLVQAVDAYLDHTGDFAFLDREVPIAGSDRRRPIYDTIAAILRYSGEVSVGKHGLPLLDRADWNDTLRLDDRYLSGPEKEIAFREQVAETGDPSRPLRSDGSESVMNAFLLKIALDAAVRMAVRRGADADADRWRARAARLVADLQRHAWKEDFFARVLFNRFADGRYAYLGAKGDSLSDDPGLDGTYFLNSFTWSILADVASEAQIQTMLDVVKRTLLTPHGLKLCSPVRYREITSRGGSAEYFPGDRENGGVFKHADMMAAVAMLRAAGEVESRALAAELRDLAYRVIDVVLPYRTMANPYVLAGNPRFCTQYNNSETGENVGPILSGTATWLWLALRTAYGIRFTPDALELNPILRDDQDAIELDLETGCATYEIHVRKAPGLQRVRDGGCRVTLDGAPVGSNRLPLLSDGARHRVEVVLDAGSA